MRKISLMGSLVVLVGLLVVSLACVPSGQVTAADKPGDKDNNKGQAPAAGQGWGTVKGQILFDGADIPKPQTVNIDKDKDHCLSKGPILSEGWVVNPKSKGVKWAVVWLAADNNVRAPDKKLPIHPDLAKPKKAEVVMDQPCCKYEPHVLAMRDDQTLVFKNSAPIAHNVKYEGGTSNPSGNPILNPGTEHKVPDKVQYAWTPISVGCSIHPWMNAWVRVFDHPYFAVTDEDGNFEIKDAPAGTYYLIVWHEGIGIKDAKTMTVDGKKMTLAGQQITIKPGGATEVEPIKIKPSEK